MNLKEFVSKERNLGKIIRFSTMLRLKDESVAEHSFHTAFYAMILCELEKQFGNKVDTEKVLKSSLLHDLEESMTGDILYSFKHSDSVLREKIKEVGKEHLDKLVEDLPSGLVKESKKLWLGDDSIESRIVEAADKIEALVYSIEELSLGNQNFKPIIDNLVKTIKSFNLKSANLFLKELGLIYKNI